jgi:hypothetical protein
MHQRTGSHRPLLPDLPVHNGRQNIFRKRLLYTVCRKRRRAIIAHYFIPSMMAGCIVMRRMSSTGVRKMCSELAHGVFFAVNKERTFLRRSAFAKPAAPPRSTKIGRRAHGNWKRGACGLDATCITDVG